MVKFEAVYKDENVLISWKTATEINNDYFSIERSDDSKGFVNIADIDGAGTSNMINDYAYNDSKVEKGKIYYYRIKQTNFDGGSSYTPLIKVECAGHDVVNAEDIKVEVFPNPFREEFSLRIQALEQMDFNLEIYNSLSKKTYEKSYNGIDTEAGIIRFSTEDWNKPRGKTKN